MRLCFKMGLFKQGLLHDLSKYSPTEFIPGVKYYQGYRSPIDAEKEDLGCSFGWLHHKGRNTHHFEYWIDKNKEGLYCHKIPTKYVLEMVCDRIAACQTYQKENYTDSAAYDYFMKGSDRLFMNQATAAQLQSYLLLVKEKGIDNAFSELKKMNSQ